MIVASRQVLDDNHFGVGSLELLSLAKNLQSALSRNKVDNDGSGSAFPLLANPVNCIKVLRCDLPQTKQVMKNMQRYLLTFLRSFLGIAGFLRDEENLQIPQSRVLFILIATLLSKFSAELVSSA